MSTIIDYDLNGAEPYRIRMSVDRFKIDSNVDRNGCLLPGPSGNVPDTLRRIARTAFPTEGDISPERAALLAAFAEADDVFHDVLSIMHIGVMDMRAIDFGPFCEFLSNLFLRYQRVATELSLDIMHRRSILVFTGQSRLTETSYQELLSQFRVRETPPVGDVISPCRPSLRKARSF